MPVSFSQAALGGEIEVPTLDGSAKIKVPPETQTGQEVSPARQGHQGRSLELSGRPGTATCGVETPVKLTEHQRKSELQVVLDRRHAGAGRRHRRLSPPGAPDTPMPPTSDPAASMGKPPPIATTRGR